MNSQLTALGSELEDLRERVHRLADGMADDAWSRRHVPDRWSVAEIVTHLNLTSEVYLPPLRVGISDPGAPRLAAGKTLRGDVTGSLLRWMMEPPVRVRLKTTPVFVPGTAAPKARVLGEFDRLQNDLLHLLRRADAVDLGKLWLVSPFNTHIKYGAYSAFRVLAAHQRRHLWLAERLTP